ncbi:MAG: class I SAM-dependent methyltransferase family protein [Candidatus Verstraetearchaeota archaeon]|nr:class I SAM-dependent methyltransferase family protein [Candidatus Verstraetearchaeota archaeon]
MRRSAVVDALQGFVGSEDLAKALKGVDIIGRIAVIKLPKEWLGMRHQIGEKILSRLDVDSVYMQTYPARPGDRVRGVEWLAGKQCTKTIHSESGCRFKVDIAKVYFSPRLSFERLRIRGLVREGETVVNMFAGVGTFSIIIAKNSPETRVFSIDNNPYAFELMLENIVINRVNGRVVPILADAREATSNLGRIADRVLMPLPELAEEYLGDSIGLLRGAGWVHTYIHESGCGEKEAVEKARERILRKAREFGEIEAVCGKVVRSVGKRNFQVVLDLKVRPN